MASSEKREVSEELMAERAVMWTGFVRLSTYAIVSIALVLILMALFLL